MKTIHLKSKSEVNFKIVLFGAILLIAGICTSCDPDDDGTTDGTSGATSQVFFKHDLHSVICEHPILMS